MTNGNEAQRLLLEILRVLKESGAPLTGTEIKKRLGMESSISLAIIWLHDLGFIARVGESDSYSSLIESKWTITPEGRSFYILFSSLPEYGQTLGNTSLSPFGLVFTVPQVPSVPEDVISILKRSGADFSSVLHDLLSSAREKVRIVSPYIDQTFLPYLDVVLPTVDIEIITNQRTPVIQRLSMRPNVRVYVLREEVGGSQIYQVHAKYICVDDSLCLVGSMNLNERSIFYNFEAGVLIRDKKTAAVLNRIFENLIKVAEPV